MKTFRWWFVAALTGTAMLILPTLGYGLGHDHGIARYLGRIILAGYWPYADAFDPAFPGGPLLHALAMAVGGNSVLALRGEDFLFQLAVSGSLFLIARRLAGPLAGLYAAWSYAILYVSGGFNDTAQGDGFMVPLLLFALLAWWKYWENPVRGRWLWWSGLCVGLACLIRPNYAIVAVVATPALLLWAKQRRGAAGIFAAMAAWPLVAFVLVFLATGHRHGLADLLRFTWDVNPSLEQVSRTTVLARFVSYGTPIVWAGAALSFFSPVWQARRKEMLSLGGLFLCTVVIRFWESKGARYQYWPPLACLVVFASIGWTWLGARIGGRLQFGRPGSVVAWILAPALLTLVVMVEFGRSGPLRYGGLRAAVRMTASDTALRTMVGDSTQARLARYLKSHTTPRDSIQLWGPGTGVLVAADRWSATRFTDPFPLFCQSGPGMPLATRCPGNWPRPIQLRMAYEITSRLTANQPRYIVAHYVNGSLAFASGSTQSPDLPELGALIDQFYKPEATFGDWTAYRSVSQ